MSTVKNVVLIGSTPALVDAGFKVTLLGRSEKNKEGLPAGVSFGVVDYNSIDSLEAAFRGQDAVVSTVGIEAVSGQKWIIDAAIKAGVKRFVPSDFGSLTTDPNAAHLPQHLAMVDIQNYIKAKASAGLIEYTIISMGAFTEFLASDILIDWQHKRAEIWGDGHARISTTSLSATGKAIAGALKNLEATKNRNIFVHEFAVSQRQYLDMAKKYAKPETKWSVTKVEDSEAELEKRIAVFKEKGDRESIYPLLIGSFLSGKYNSHYKHTDNSLVGLEELSEAEFEAKVANACS
ncbi:hypothetical protein C7974DRAFT_470305 [Boeremia exigua]|uniref:uncharacterized protein n=1 Tax=Boeremia exigua TaxID=749465 RepID=UPI001E8ECB78|nr:uncharacterized protein C7974DRAFT_470305 [Boeremia exigua]KAH6639899.1 hypothetical protein C7974DRAFT_470305 [Boeremia exigua]